MLFIDNADSPDLNLGPYLPSSSHGAILITTRNQNWREYAPDSAIHVGGLTESEAVDLLHITANVTPASNEASLEIVRELGMLALAVTQAGAYILKTRRLSSYLGTLRSHRDELLRESPINSTKYPHSTYAAFDLSFHQLPSKVQKLLGIFAHLYPSGIPLSLFKRSSVSGFIACTVLESFPPPESDEVVISYLKEILGLAWDEKSFQDMIDAAQRASFITTFTDDTDCVFYSIHPLLQKYIAGAIEDTDGAYARMAAQVLLGATQHSEESNRWYWQILPHIDTIPQSVKTANIAHALAFNQIYESLSVWKESKRLLEFTHSKIREIHGRLHEDSIRMLSRIANVMCEIGQHLEAEKLEREVLAMSIELHGRRHSDTARAMNYLGNTLNSRGQLEEAERLQREGLDINLELLGRRHLNTITAISDLANTLYARGQLEKVEKLQREVLDMRIELLGRRHLATITAIGDVANTLRARDQLEEAEKLEREVLDMSIELRGRRHSDTLTAMGNLAYTLYARDQLEEAEELEREVFGVRIELVGRRHLETITAMGNLAVTLRVRGQLEEAEKLGREVLDVRIELQGRHHLEAIKAMGNLAITLLARDLLEEAENLARETVQLGVGTLGEEHSILQKAQQTLKDIADKRAHSQSPF